MTAAEQLLNDLRAFITRYVWFPSEHHAAVVALWIAHTWTVTAFYTTPRLILDSAEPGSGKTRVLELLALLCRSAKLTLSTTTAALYRRIAATTDEEMPPPTILQDESDAVFGKTTSPQTEDLRALFNAGYKRGATVDRCEGDAKNMKVREFPVFAPVAFAGLAGKMPATIVTRAVTLHMRRRRPGDPVAEYRERDAKLYATPLCDRLELWASQSTDALAEARPAMPDGVRDRAAEVWEPLLAIADQAGGDWPGIARAACRYFVVDSATEDEKLSLGQRLLRDIKTLLDTENATAMWSSDIIAKLIADPESEWRDLWGKPLDQRRLAKELGKYGVKSQNVRIGIGVSKGYATDGPTGLHQAWEHWLTPSVSATSATSATLQVNALRTVADTDAAATSATDPLQGFSYVDLEKQENVADVADVALTDGIGQPDRPTPPEKCPDCRRAPARSDTGRCDFCTAKHRRQRTNGNRPKLSCPKWINQHVAELRASGIQYIASFAVYEAGRAVGYSKSSIGNAAQLCPDIRIAANRAGVTWWCIDPTEAITYKPLSQFIDDYLSAHPPTTEVVDQSDFYAAVDAAGLDRTSARTALTRSGRIDSQPAPGQSHAVQIWRLRPKETA